MNQPFSVRNKEVLVGSFVLIAGAVFLTLLLLTLMRHEIFEERYTLKTIFSMGIGLNAGTSVCLSGLTIGTVESVELNEDGRILVSMRVKKSYQNRIRANSMATVRRLNPAVGDKLINLSQGTEESAVLQDNDFILSENPAELDDALVYLSRMSEQINKIISRIEKGEGTIGALLKDRSIIDSINTLFSAGSRTLMDGRRLLRNLDHLSREVTDVIGDTPELIQKLSLVADSVNALLGKVDGMLEVISDVGRDSGPLLMEGRDKLYDAGDIVHSLKKNWLIRWNLPKETDTLIYEETRQ